MSRVYRESVAGMSRDRSGVRTGYQQGKDRERTGRILALSVLLCGQTAVYQPADVPHGIR